MHFFLNDLLYYDEKFHWNLLPKAQLVQISTDNGLVPGWQAIIWTTDGIV